MISQSPENRSALSHRRLFVTLLLGFASGLPLSLTGSTMQAWLTMVGIDIKTIAIFSLVGLPYALKFLWAPLMDRFVPAWLGRRRGWILLTQIPLVGLIASLGLLSPDEAVLVIGTVAVVIAFISASQDIAVDAYRTDLLDAHERRPGAALSVVGYRTAMLVSGGLALIFAEHAGWAATYVLMAALLGIGVAGVLIGPEVEQPVSAPKTLQGAVIDPFTEFMRRNDAVSLLILIALYKFGDAFAGSLTTTFLLRGLGFSLTDVGIVNKWMGLVASIVGGLLGGGLMLRFGLYRCLLGFGILQALTNLGFVLLALAGRNYAGMVAVIAAENFAGGMGTAVLVALLMALCDRRYSATQFALLSALAAVGRVVSGPFAGVAVDTAGWANFFVLTFLAAVPGLGLLVYLRSRVEQYDY